MRDWLEHCSFGDNLYIKRLNEPYDCSNERDQDKIKMVVNS